MMAAAIQSTTRQNGGHHRVFATNLRRCCQRSLSPWPARPRTSSHGDRGHGRRGDDDEDRSDGALDGDHRRASIGDREADVDRRDQYEPERVDRSRIEPPERERRRRLDCSPDESPHDGRTQRRLGRVGIVRSSYLRLRHIGCPAHAGPELTVRHGPRRSLPGWLTDSGCSGQSPSFVVEDPAANVARRTRQLPDVRRRAGKDDLAATRKRTASTNKPDASLLRASLRAVPRLRRTFLDGEMADPGAVAHGAATVPRWVRPSGRPQLPAERGHERPAIYVGSVVGADQDCVVFGCVEREGSYETGVA